MAGEFNTLIISDLHLGEDLNPSSPPQSSPQLAILERQLIGFLRHYARTRRDGRAWRLVINGDMVDFLNICLLPGAEHDDVTPDEHAYGLGRRPRVACAKMDAVIDRHPGVFAAFARFVAAGNRIDIVAGNHDVELHWKPVQLAMLEGIRRSWENSQIARGRATNSDFIAERIAFHPWFFYEPGVVWVEHGHLYDENCSTEFALAPAHPDSKEIELNVDASASRYVITQIPEAEYGQENWSGLGYVKWGMSLGPRGLVKLSKGYYQFASSLIQTARRRAKLPAVREARRRRHRERMVKLCEQVRLSEDTLHAVDALRKEPVVTNVWRLMQVLMIDKVLIAAVTTMVLLVTALSFPLWWGLFAAATTLGVAYGASTYLSRGRNVMPSGPLSQVPERILRHVDARFVVFGHSHEPEATPLPDGKTYFNTGTWYPDEAPGLLRSFTHVVLRSDDSGSRAELMQWRDGASRAFTPGYSVRERMLPARSRAASEPGIEAAAVERAAA